LGELSSLVRPAPLEGLTLSLISSVVERGGREIMAIAVWEEIGDRRQ